MPSKTAELSSADSPRLTLSVPEAAARLGISRGLAWDLIHAGGIPSCRLGRRVLVPEAALEATVRDLTRGGPEPKP
jgi:excisionase family DNA binding protein